MVDTVCEFSVCVYPGSLLAPLTIDEDVEDLIRVLKPESAVVEVQDDEDDSVVGTATFVGFGGLAG